MKKLILVLIIPIIVLLSACGQEPKQLTIKEQLIEYKNNAPLKDQVINFNGRNYGLLGIKIEVTLKTGIKHDIFIGLATYILSPSYKLMFQVDIYNDFFIYNIVAANYNDNACLFQEYNEIQSIIIK